MAVQRGVLGPLIFLARSCSHEPAADPTLGELQGEWTMSWTESGAGVTCRWSDVTLSLRDSTKGTPGIWGGGQGSCVGLVEGDNLVLVTFALESLTVRDGRIRFVPQGSTYHFEGRVTADEMNGTMSANPFYPDAGIQVETAGSWRAARELIP
jgi:hypothetical protein